MHILKDLDQIKPPDEIPELREITKHKIQLEPEEISLAKTLVEKMSNKALDLTEYSDSYSKEHGRVVEAKIKGKPIVTKHEPKPKDIPTDHSKHLKQVCKSKSPKNNYCRNGASAVGI